MISIKPHSSLGIKYSQLTIECEEGLTVKKILDRLDLDGGYVVLILVNGKIVEENFILSGGDKIELYPVVGGG